MGALFRIKVLTRWEFLNHLMTIIEDRRTEIPSVKDFLGCSHPKKMTATCFRVEIIQNLFNFFMCKTLSKNGVYTMSIQRIIQNEIIPRVVTDAMKIVTRHVGMKSLGLEINY